MNALAASTRRDFLKITLSAAGGLLVSFGPAPLPALSLAAQAIGVYVRIEPDGRVLIGARGCEIGQGVKTSLPMLIAEELDVDWAQVTVEQLPYVLDATSGESVSRFGDQGAGGSTSISDAWDELRQVGAAARQVLLEEAAERWKLPLAQLRTESGRVLGADGRVARYADLAAGAARRPLAAAPVALKAVADYRIIGKPTRVADAREIVTGAPLFGLDQSLAGALVAVVLRSPQLDGEIEAVDDRAALKVPGVRAVVRIEGARAGEAIDANLAAGVAVLADDTWAALQGRKALIVRFKDGPWRRHDSARLRREADVALDGESAVEVQAHGDLAAAARSARQTITARYYEPLLAHATMEPMNAIFRIDGDRALLIAPLQSPGGASRMIASLTGLKRENIEIRLTRCGGGFGRRLQNDFVAEAVRIAIAAKCAVKVLWTREDDIQHDYYRQYGAHELVANLDSAQALSGWRHRVAATSIKARKTAMAEAADWVGCHELDEFPAHLVPAWRHEYVALQTGVARGWWRAPLPNFIAFPVQSFVDEVAHALRRDPLELRLAMLGEPRKLPYQGHGGPEFDTGRMSAVLRLVADKIGWGRDPGKGRGLGIAGHFVFGGYAAHAFEVSVDGQGELAIHRCVCAVDVGQVVNPLGVEAQMMGATIDGLSTALGLEITLKDGQVQQSNFHDYPLLPSAKAPDVEVHIVASHARPSGAGEMGIPTVAPALANAIFAATGKRIRELPLAKSLREAMA